jgi:F0F1-type ATP synthase epsilon subunit
MRHGFDLSVIHPDQKGLSEEVDSLNVATEGGSAA